MKVTAVLIHAGRSGSSMTMGLLERSGVDVGKVHRQTSKQNEKGFYEILEMQQWWKEIYKEINFLTFMSPTPSLKKAKEISLKHRDENTKMIKKYFTGDHIAIKCSFIIPVLLFDPQIFDVQIVKTVRRLETQVESVKKWNIREGDFKSWLKEWNLFYNNFSGKVFRFEAWQNDPYGTYLKLYRYVKPPKKMTKEEVNEWFDPKLVHYA